VRVATRLALGAGLLVALLAAVTTFQLTRLRQVSRATRELATVDFRSATALLELARSADRLDEAVRKLYVLRDQGYAALVVEVRDRLGATLASLSQPPASPAVVAQITEAAEAWRSFPLSQPSPEGVLSRSLAGDRRDTLRAALSVVAQVRSAADAALAAGQREIGTKVSESAAIVAGAERVTVTLLGVSLLVAVVVVWVTVRSIVRPLDRLVSGTRTVGEGSFEVRLDDRGPAELATLAGEFNRMVERLGELDQLKRHFVSHVSHELKTPLVAMRETTSLLLDGEPGPLNDGQRRMLQLNLKAAKRLSAMIADLLDVSRMEAGAMEFDLRPLALAEVVETAVAELAPWAAERGVSLGSRVAPQRVDCDRDRVAQVLVNLIDNAVRHSEAGGAVEVVATEDGRDGDATRIRVSVVDHGPGVAQEDRERIFARFQQGGGGRRGSGVGLGLAICREIVAAHGGTIRVMETPGGGATFTFDLPRAGNEG